jgi:hypothetical protein
VGFKTEIPVLKRLKTVHVYDEAASVVGHHLKELRYYKYSINPRETAYVAVILCMTSSFFFIYLFVDRVKR